MAAEYRLYYDGSCGLCRLSVQAVVWLRPEAKLRLVDASQARELAAYASMSRSRAMRSVVLELPSGHFVSGFDAVVEILRLIPTTRWAVPILLLPPVRWLGSLLYHAITRYRHQLSRVLRLDARAGQLPRSAGA